MIAMWVIWLFAIYGFSAILVHLFKRWNPYYEGVRDMHVQLLLYNSERCLEGAVRSLVSLSRLEGRPIHMKVVDFGSTDRTPDILDMLQKEHPFLFEQIVVGESPVSLVSLEEQPRVRSRTIDLREGKKQKKG